MHLYGDILEDYVARELPPHTLAAIDVHVSHLHKKLGTLIHPNGSRQCATQDIFLSFVWRRDRSGEGKIRCHLQYIERWGACGKPRFTL